MQNKVLLLGNGINTIKSDYTWEQLIDDLIEYIGAAGQIDKNNKPFPLLYEEIFIEAVKNRGIKEKKIKNFIASKVSNLKPNDIHKNLINLGISNYLTTNYDYTLESTINSKIKKLNDNGIIKQNTYSLFRHNKIGEKIFWHIHGEANIPSTITLGYDHYSGYLQRMRNYVVAGEKFKKFSFEPLIKKLTTGEKLNFDSWIEYFFKKDIYIIGLTLDFVEMHLWWLITYRARIKYKKEIPINNRIFYFYPDHIASTISNKIDLMKISDVTPFSIPFRKNNWLNYYNKIINKICEGM